MMEVEVGEHAKKNERMRMPATQGISILMLIDQ